MYLKHHGVKGMKWGVSKRSSGGMSSGSASKLLKEIESEMSRTKDRNKLDSLKKEYGKIEDSISYSKSSGSKKTSFKEKVANAGRAYNRRLEKGRKIEAEKVKNRHSEYSSEKRYMKDYEKSLKRTGSKQQAMRTAQTARRLRKDNRAALTITAGILATSKAIEVATRPESIRAGKNIIQAIRNSPIRYVDGATMANVIRSI